MSFVTFRRRSGFLSRLTKERSQGLGNFFFFIDSTGCYKEHRIFHHTPLWNGRTWAQVDLLMEKTRRELLHPCMNI